MDLLQITSAVCVVAGILLLKKIVNVIPSLIGCLVRWKECLNLEDSMRLSGDRNIVAVFLTVPFCLCAAEFRLYDPLFLGGLQPAAYFGCICGIFAGYCLLRMLAAVMVRRTKVPEKTFKAANRSSFSFFCIMSAAVQFNDQSGLGAIKVRDIIANGFLPLKAEGIVSEELIPQFAFPRSHIFAQLFGAGNVFLPIWLHALYPALTSASKPPRRARR